MGFHTPEPPGTSGQRGTWPVSPASPSLAAVPGSPAPSPLIPYVCHSVKMKSKCSINSKDGMERFKYHYSYLYINYSYFCLLSIFHHEVIVIFLKIHEIHEMCQYIYNSDEEKKLERKKVERVFRHKIPFLQNLISIPLLVV